MQTIVSRLMNPIISRMKKSIFIKRTEKLLQWGVEKVIWVFSSSRRVLIADNLQKWEFNSWDIPFNVIDDIEMNVWELMLKSGFEVGK